MQHNVEPGPVSGVARRVGPRVRVLIGAAGTGKTTRLLGLLDEAVDSTGAGPAAVLFASLTRAARQEAAERASRRWGVPPESLLREGWFRTVHAIAYWAAGAAPGALLTDSADSARWIATATGGLDPDGRALAAWDRSRARLEPFDGGAYAAAAVESYERAKRVEGRVDYTDLLAAFAGVRFSAVAGLKTCEPIGEVPPGIMVAAFDEHQDASPLLDRCCRRIIEESSDLREAIFAGDPHQSIYGFLGASPQPLLQWTDAAQEVEYQEQTHRCAAQVVAAGEAILRATDAYRPRSMRPAPGRHGEIRTASADEAIAAIRASEGSVFVLSRCGFTANRYRDMLALAGIPSRSIESQGPSARTVALATLCRLERDEVVDAADFAHAVAALPAQPFFRRGAKTKWKDASTAAAWGAIERGQILDAGATEELLTAISDGSWTAHVDGSAAWRERAMACGIDEMVSPRVRVGTIHAAKGMETDLVVVSTETSAAAARSDHDEERRIAYVAITRTRGSVIVVPEGQMRSAAMEEIARLAAAQEAAA